MALYLISIGGTGHHLCRAILHLAATGALSDCGAIKLLAVDSDTANGSLKGLAETVTTYKDIPAFTTLTPAAATVGAGADTNFCWTPDTGGNNLATQYAKPLMSTTGAEVMDLLYTGEEQTVDLKFGFYGHPSIGALMLGQQIDNSLNPPAAAADKVWDNFFKGFDPAADKILLTGSIFGGTGASGIPTAAKLLRAKFTNAHIGVIMTLPYFQFLPPVMDDGGTIGIDWTYFVPKAKVGLTYYEKQGFNQVFDQLYLIGENQETQTVLSYCAGGANQDNPVRAIELYGATAAIDFIHATPQGGNGVVRMMNRNLDINGNELCDSNMLSLPGIAANLPHELARLLQFAVMYTKYYYPCIQAGKAEGAWFANYSLPGTAEDSRWDSLNTYCQQYIEWTHQLSMDTDVNTGTIGVVPADYVQLFDFSNTDLFNCDAEIGSFLGFNKKIIISNNLKAGIATIAQGGEMQNANRIDEYFNGHPDCEDTDYMTRFVRDLYAACG